MEEGDVRKSKSNISKSWKNPFADVGLKQPLLQQLINSNFHSIIPSTFICWNSAIRINFSCFLFFLPLFIYMSMDLQIHILFYLSFPLIFMFKLLHIWLEVTPSSGSCPVSFGHVSIILSSLPYFVWKQTAPIYLVPYLSQQEKKIWLI